ncbi:MAG: PH domain-containing protein [Opitutaceae bacterium]|nr:PH domain-containing protein [Opitutaceae bacterium]
MPKKEYPSAVDAWLAAILAGVPLAIILHGIHMLARSTPAGVASIITGVLTGVLIALFSIPCVYTIGEGRLKIRCGLVKYNVPLAKIINVERSSSIWSAPALSLRRVLVTTEDGSYLISPRDRDGFIAGVLAEISREKKNGQSPGGEHG